LIPTHFQTLSPDCSVEGWWSLANEELGASCLGDAVRKREFEVLGEELLDIGALDVVGLLEFNNLEDLFVVWSVYSVETRGRT
jgi:hypothetical protein